jgi:acyl-CoA synthetase (AMP-forming)/AMP-acid ligase II
MNSFDYLLGQSGFLYKDFLLGNKEKLSYSELYDRSVNLARFIQNAHGQNNNIILISPNSSFFVIIYLAIMKSGNICVPLNPSIEKHNLEFISSLCDSGIAFISPSLKNFDKDLFNYVYTEIPVLQHEDLIHTLADGSDEAFSSERLAEIIFTSGSTGVPKGVMLTHKNIIANTESIIQYLQLTGDDIVEVVLPFYYCYGLSLLHTHLKVGGSVVFNNNFMFLGSVIQDLKSYRCTGFAGVPSHYQVLLRKSTSFKNSEFPDLRYVTQAGGKLHNAFIREFVDNFPGIEFFVMYGQTEATARLSFLPSNMVIEKLGSIGKAIPGVQLDILDDSGNTLEEPGKVGELVARGDNIMKGYLGDKEDTRKTLQNGWLHTGDLAYRDEEGYFYLTARKKEIIKVGGKRISPKEIEEVIFGIPGIIDCSIIGIYDDILGEALKAEIVVNELKDPNELEKSVKMHCAQRLAAEKIPQLFEFKRNIEIAATGKKVKKG